MKWIFYLAALTAALLFPVKRSDVGKLQPIEVISVYIEDGNAVVETDTGDLGKGLSLDEALENLKRTTPGIVYLDTAEYLIVGENAEDQILKARAFLKDEVKLCSADPGIDLAQAAQYLDAHNPEQTLGEWEKGAPMEHLKLENERLKLEGKETEKS